MNILFGTREGNTVHHVIHLLQFLLLHSNYYNSTALPTHSSFQFPFPHQTLQLFEMQKGKDNKEKEKGKAAQQAQPQQIKPLPQAQGPQSNNQEEKVSPLKEVKIEEVGISGFIEEKLQAHIQEGLKEIVHFRPEDPIKYLGDFLLKRSEKFQ